MSKEWTKRMHDTRRLIGAVADHLFSAGKVPAAALHALCHLTWVNSENDGPDPSYVSNIKIPALVAIFGDSVDSENIKVTGRLVAARLGIPPRWVIADTGLTNFYNAYRGGTEGWFRKNRGVVEKIVRSARNLRSPADAIALAAAVEKLPPIPMRGDNATKSMRAAFALTPLLFALDPRNHFPIINGRDGVRALLTHHRMGSAELPDQVRTMVRYIGQPGIRNASDLDVKATADLAVAIEPIAKDDWLRKPLTRQPVGKGKLNVKDDSDVESLSKSTLRKRRRLHNTMTNELLDLFDTLELSEGRNRQAMFDVLIESYNHRNDDLLIEVKSSVDDGPIRMAIGQLYAYHHQLGNPRRTALAIVVPERPPESILALLSHLSIGCMWFADGRKRLVTETPSLKCLERP